MTVNRRQPLLTETLTPSPSKKPSTNVGEVAGVTTANCVVVCCCCPCILLEIIFIAVYKVPVTIFRRILKKRRKKRMMKKIGFLEEEKSEKEVVGSSVGYEVYYKAGFDDRLSNVDLNEFKMIKVCVDGFEDVELDRKMWDQFHDAGFWRSSSRRDS